MRRFRLLVAASLFVAPVIAGCDSGIQEGMAPNTDAAPAKASMRSEMEKNAKNMQLKQGKPKGAPSAPAEKPK